MEDIKFEVEKSGMDNSIKKELLKMLENKKRLGMEIPQVKDLIELLSK